MTMRESGCLGKWETCAWIGVSARMAESMDRGNGQQLGFLYICRENIDSALGQIITSCTEYSVLERDISLDFAARYFWRCRDVQFNTLEHYTGGTPPQYVGRKDTVKTLKCIGWYLFAPPNLGVATGHARWMPFSCPLFPAIARPMPRHEATPSTTSTTPNSTSTSSRLPPPTDIPHPI